MWREEGVEKESEYGEERGCAKREVGRCSRTYLCTMKMVPLSLQAYT